MSPKFFPSILILLSWAASVVYFWHLDWRMGLYWLSAGVLNAAVTW